MLGDLAVKIVIHMTCQIGWIGNLVSIPCHILNHRRDNTVEYENQTNANHKCNCMCHVDRPIMDGIHNTFPIRIIDDLLLEDFSWSCLSLLSCLLSACLKILMWSTFSEDNLISLGTSFPTAISHRMHTIEINLEINVHVHLLVAKVYDIKLIIFTVWKQNMI